METLMHREMITEITVHYQALSKLVPLQAIPDAPAYEQAVSVLHQLLDAGAADEKHPLAGLVDSIGRLIADYDQEHFPAAPVSPAATLRQLMEQHALTQSDVPEVGTQGVVSEVLNGKRDLNVRQIKALAQRFDVPPSVFIA
ncbi:transcriptional regulator [Janthinobacterium agaricidamnosum]|uniref:Transcriptional regulator n=1 Tax=Janthinobacterium agaricidamnosum TaxID=55508 RepID=A0A3G2E5X8_9BURK|nr:MULTISPECIES: helix-turn-helix domain-containing protein [Janthinobacterium]AYM75643.1 transcriptional regulator [Janthinobacterium agaricidamnosum]OEZ83603.1 antitoxin HigA [Janthinobacterium sp. HH106]OEZ92845.1 antitoxin HigA [Janthinobacterium sp. HH107]PHV37479.1 transcriptional regulator [Janthinobacterium sp. BJB304]